MNYFKNIQTRFGSSDALFKLIAINVAVFLVPGIITIFLELFKSHSDFFKNILAMSSSLNVLLTRPWTIITYMFFHQQIFHLLFNMLALYWFGKIFAIYFNEKQLVAVYLLGGIVGGLTMLAAYNSFPIFNDIVPLLGASGSVMAIITAAAVQTPNMELRFFMFPVKLKYIAIGAIVISFFGITKGNAGGEFAHLGGALLGLIFVLMLRQGKDITSWLNKLIDSIVSLFSKPKPKLKVSKPNWQNQQMSDAEYNVNKAARQEEIDRILDKIKASGYESLTADEKRRLFEQGKK
ncbi:MAG: rhomboid family intramembrane serine protease [Paludibacter sp.]|jgi:membrane associated rhomboid family serine protease|nr:rhomboid family intramembrane serine protease [Paludibacter sp.]